MMREERGKGIGVTMRVLREAERIRKAGDEG